ncbi:hypothetical protein [Streptomyces sp. NPDC056468]|uniref:hypothetical protein n=1 Tax=Streptomyces sp. NPDC056468 TaxID=3345830 RepID=UPI0036853DAB
MADPGGAAQFVAVAAGDGFDEVGVKDGQALEVVASGVAFDTTDVFARPGVEPVGQLLGEQRAEQHAGQHQAELGGAPGREDRTPAGLSRW